MKYIVDIKGEIEGDYEIIGKYEERPQGEWYEKRIDEVYGNPPHGYLTRYEWRCSVCENTPYYSNDIHTLHFCPNCGADMRGEQE